MKNTLQSIRKLLFRGLGIGVIGLMLNNSLVTAQTANQYGFAASSGTFTPLVSPTNSSLANTADDAISTAIPIGFTFNYVGTNYTDVRVSSNGHLVFGTAGANSTGNDLTTTTTTTRPGLAPLWDDIQCTMGVKYQVSGTAPNQVFTAEWLNMEWNYGSNTAVISFQVKLYEGTNNIEFVYRQEATAVNNGSASIGIMGTASTDFISLQNTTASPTVSTTTAANGLNSKPATGQVYTFTPPPMCSGTPAGGLTSLTTIPGCGAGNFALAVAANYERGTTYQWQSSPDGLFWTDMTNDTLATYTGAPVTAGTYYRRNTICTSTAMIGSSTAILVKPVYGGNSQSTSAVCGDSITLSLTNTSASISTFQWLESTDSLTWTPIFAATTSTSKVPSPTTRTYYRAYVTCSTTSTSDTSIAVAVNPVRGGTSVITSSFCLDSTLISLTNASSGAALTYNWLSSTDSLTWTSMGITTATAKFPSPTAKRYYKAVLTCGLSSDSSVAVAVNEPCNGFSYSITPNSSATFTSIQTTGNQFTWAGTGYDDDRTFPVYFPSGFNFTYNGQVRPAFYACINGWLSFDTATISTAWGNDLNSTSPRLVLAPFWDDLAVMASNAANKSLITYQLTGTAPNRVMTIEWAEIERLGYPAASFNFQIKLYEGTNNIEYVYGRMQAFDGTGTGDFTYSLGMSGNTPAAGQRLSLLVPNTSNFSASTVNNNLTIAPKCNTSYLFTAGGVFNPTFTSAIPSNDSSSTPVALAVNAAPCTDACGTYYSTLNATPSGTAIAPVSGTPDDDVWFSFVAPASGQVNISVVASSGFNPAFQVMTTSFDTTGMGDAGSRNAATNALESVVANTLTPSTTYLIRLFNAGTGSGSTSGAFSICVNEVIPPPANDDTTGAILLTASTTCSPTAGTTLGATASPQAVCGGLPDDDVWYKFYPSAAVDTITIDGSGTFRAYAELFSPSLVSLGCLGTTTNGGTLSAIASGLNLDSLYFIRVYHSNAGTASANFTICITGDSATAPVVSNLTPINLYDITATLVGNIVSGGGVPITRSGVVYGPTANPVIGDPGVVDSTTNPVATIGTFYLPVTGLNPSTVYHYRTYATNILGTTYGPDSTFTTLAAPTVPTVGTIVAYAQTTTAMIGGNITGNGGSAVTSNGIVYGLAPNPTIGDPGVVDSLATTAATMGAYFFTMEGLTHSTKYYFRAYASNIAGIAYSATDSFTTAPIVSVLPYTENFDAATTPWTTYGVAGGSNAWEKGTPAKTYLSGAFSAPNAFVTKLTGNYLGGENSALESPQFDFSNFSSNPILRFKHKFDTDNDPNYDGVVVEISTDGGATWTKLDAIVGTGTNYNTDSSYAWYNNASTLGLGANKFSSRSDLYASQINGWIESATTLTGAAGQSNVKVRFRFWADGVVDEGWAIDDIEVVEIGTPSIPTSSVVFSGINASNTTVSWTNGDGNGRLVVARLATSTPVTPTNYKLYRANAAYADGDSTGLENYVVYSGTGSSVPVIGLDSFTTYVYDVYEYSGKYMHLNYTTVAGSNSATTLPVEFVSFTANAQGKDVLVSWTTASEVNNHGFEVQRSVDGRSFETVAFVKGAGNSSRALNYNSTDVRAFAKANVLYYRLKQVDFNGKFAYSNVVRVSSNNQLINGVAVAPNPFSTDFAVSFNAAAAGTVKVELMDIQGRLVGTQSFEAIAGDNKVTFDQTTAINAGVYFVKVYLNGETQVMKLVKN